MGKGEVKGEWKAIGEIRVVEVGKVKGNWGWEVGKVSVSEAKWGKWN